MPILGTLARPLLVSAVGAISGEVLKGLGKRFWGEKEKEGTEEEGRKGFSMPRNNILLAKTCKSKTRASTQGSSILSKIRKGP